MIEWTEYDKNSREIESHVNHLTTDGTRLWVLQHAKRINGEGYAWYEGKYPLIDVVTHWSKINLPQAIETNEPLSVADTEAEREC